MASEEGTGTHGRDVGESMCATVATQAHRAQRATVKATVRGFSRSGVPQATRRLMRVCAQNARNMSVCGYVEVNVNARVDEPLSIH